MKLKKIKETWETSEKMSLKSCGVVLRNGVRGTITFVDGDEIFVRSLNGDRMTVRPPHVEEVYLMQYMI